MEDVRIFYGPLVHFTVFCYIYGHLVYVVRGTLVYFSRFGILYREKSGNPGLGPNRVESKFFRPKEVRTHCFPIRDSFRVARWFIFKPSSQF
jgi:hypothetical protein